MTIKIELKLALIELNKMRSTKSMANLNSVCMAIGQMTLTI